MKLEALNKAVPHWPSTDVGTWTPESADFPRRMALGGHAYQLVERTLLQPFDGEAFWSRLIGVVQAGAFAPWLCFVWSPWGRFNCVEQEGQSGKPLHELIARGGALYVRVDG